MSLEFMYAADPPEIEDIDDLSEEQLEELAGQIVEEMRERGHISNDAQGYVEPGYTTPEKPGRAVLFGNWNHCAHFRTQKHYADLAVLERYGHELEWEDEWSTCVDCGKAFRTSPDSYSWKRSYWLKTDEDGDGAEEVCVECVLEDPEDYLEYLKGNERASATFNIDLQAHGYRLYKDDLERGLHRGQSDNPDLIAKALRARGIEDFVFKLESSSQFYSTFSVWIPEDTELEELPADEMRDPPGKGPAEMMERALLDSSAKEKAVAGQPGITVVKLHGDGTSDVKKVSPEDFVAGRALD